MNDMPQQDQNAVATEQRGEWAKPVVARIDAGSAENVGATGDDGVLGITS